MIANARLRDVWPGDKFAPCDVFSKQALTPLFTAVSSSPTHRGYWYVRTTSAHIVNASQDSPVYIEGRAP